LPFYDLTCPNNHQQFNLWLKVGERPPCPACGEATETLWVGKGNNVIQDSIEGGLLIEHGRGLINPDGSPRRYYSKTEIAQAAKAAGLIPYVRHVPGSTETVDWAAAIDPVTMENARVLVSRGVGGSTKSEDAAERASREQVKAIAKRAYDRLEAQ
jgi:hypothetical protein